MAKTTEKYELMYIINPNLSEKARHGFGARGLHLRGAALLFASPP